MTDVSVFSLPPPAHRADTPGWTQIPSTLFEEHPGHMNHMAAPNDMFMRERFHVLFG